jgi:hypothetical protein
MSRNADIDDELQRLQGGTEMFEPGAKNALAKVGICSDWIVLRVQSAEKLPKNETGITGDAAHYSNELSSAPRLSRREGKRYVLTT